jgi:hypothetical protein
MLGHGTGPGVGPGAPLARPVVGSGPLDRLQPVSLREHGCAAATTGRRSRLPRRAPRALAWLRGGRCGWRRWRSSAPGAAGRCPACAAWCALIAALPETLRHGPQRAGHGHTGLPARATWARGPGRGEQQAAVGGGGRRRRAPWGFSPTIVPLGTDPDRRVTEYRRRISQGVGRRNAPCCPSRMPGPHRACRGWRAASSRLRRRRRTMPGSGAVALARRPTARGTPPGR